MAPTLGRLEVHDMSSDIATAENRQTLQMSSANRGNGETRHDGATVPDEQQTEVDRVSHANGNGGDVTQEQQTEHGSVSHANELNLQANEEQRRDVTTPYDTTTITAQYQQAENRANAPPQASAAPEHPQPVVNEAPHPLSLSELLRVQDEQEGQISRIYEEIRTSAMRQAQMAAQYQASRAETRAQMQAVLEAQRKSDEQAQKTQDEVKKMKEELNVKVEETVREQLRVAVDQEVEGMLRKKLPKVIKKEIKREAKKEKVKKEKAAGKPKKNWSLFNIHVMEERKRLKALGPVRDLFQVASRSWGEMSEEERTRQYGDIFTLDKERYEREMEGWWNERKILADQRKPAAKPSPEELAATADPQEFAADAPIETRSPPEESAPIAATVGPGDPDEGYQLSPYEQMVQDKRARNQEHMRRLGLGGGSLSRIGKTAMAGSSVRGNRNTEEPAVDPTVGNLNVQGSSPSASSNNKGREANTDHPQEPFQPLSEEPVAAAAAENLPQVVVNSFAGVSHSQHRSIHTPDLHPIAIAPSGTEATLNDVVFPPPTTTIVINRRQEVHGATVALDEERTGDPSRATYPEAVPFLGVERISQEEQPVHAEEVRQSNSVPEAASLPEIDANHHRDNTEGAVGSASARRLQESTASLASNGDGNTQELPSVSARRPRGKKRKNHSPYWFRNAPVYELEGYTDGTPLQAGFVWVEYDSGIAVQVKEVELGKKLPPRNSRRRLSHNLLGNNRSQNGSTELQCPVGYRFIRSVPPSKYRAGYDCDAEVVEVDGDWRHCKYVDFRGKERIGKLKLRTIQDA
eukprot:CAMPEP_0113371464 /NCGR_PEP_ID=MMETSP0013_2-20120614/26_1 /TAXON_ID=2843 ORGANISM="Skeletonema costatum, Strain 1716" /NCGR_SAMPLE_ID=MMETSP0013_2 /ASSEMBLY_ACC=CAM_ASM_000158 /LENGTH=805 /DNA_ID=CAMNT_0000253313 /DNA_START=6644 /DNA_END=9061 /DNA_ORIENTATION=- /assembly_acc=CAM_ASM_000158